MSYSPTQKAYIAGFLDGDGSIYVRLKPNPEYRYGFQVAPYVVFFQSSKDCEGFNKICNLIGCRYLRKRNDGMLEYVIQRRQAIQNLIGDIRPFLLLKEKQADLILEVLKKKVLVKSRADFIVLMNLIDQFRELNYSKKRRIHVLTP